MNKLKVRIFFISFILHWIALSLTLLIDNLFLQAIIGLALLLDYIGTNILISYLINKRWNIVEKVIEQYKREFDIKNDKELNKKEREKIE